LKFYNLYQKLNPFFLWVSKFTPKSYQTKFGKSFQKNLKRELLAHPSSKEVLKKTKHKDLEVVIIYKLTARTKRDVDNLTKNIIDSMKKIVFDDDSQIKLLIIQKDFIELEEPARKRGLEKVIIIVNEYGKSKISIAINEFLKQ
jgi:Holliday junction resolvase RusA-like endonuclease